ncbi:hypothetical protein ABH944_009104 [Caballeronia udeis]|uniref:Uncharacterized protein n=1 Tax=Caballeronia udeis TaxID=1232866 RepID=A0ABW8N496_9BURK
MNVRLVTTRVKNTTERGTGFLSDGHVSREGRIAMPSTGDLCSVWAWANVTG